MKSCKLSSVLAAVVLSLFYSSAVFALGGDFQLTDQRGQAFKLSDHKDKVVVMVFGYSYCPDRCPDPLETIAGALDILQDPEDVQVVFVSVDHHNDDPEQLRAYLTKFDQRYIGVTGSELEIKKAAKKWNVHFTKSKQSNSNVYLVDNSSDIYVIDRSGKAHGVVPFNVRGEHLAKVLQSAIALEKMPAAPAVGLVNMSNQTVDVFAQSSKATVLHFWATWCVPCREEFSDLEAAKANIEKLPLDFYAISLGDEFEQIRSFLKQYPLSYTMLSDRTGYSGDNWQVKSLPMTVVLSPDGREVARLRGMQPWGDATFIEKLRQLVQ